jgi:hypothetical protein
MSSTVEALVKATKPIVKLRRQLVSFACLQVEPVWRRLSEEERRLGKDEFEAAVR